MEEPTGPKVYEELRAPGRFRYFAVFIAVCASFLPGCNGCNSCNLHPTLTVTSNQNTLTITGTGFNATTNRCAHLGLIGLPAAKASLGNVSIGDVTNCSGGSFQITWTPQYVNANYCVNPQPV